MKPYPKQWETSYSETPGVPQLSKQCSSNALHALQCALIIKWAKDEGPNAVFLNLENNPGKEALIEKIKNFKSDITDLPLAPKEFIHYYEENDRPQPLLDRDNEKATK